MATIRSSTPLLVSETDRDEAGRLAQVASPETRPRLGFASIEERRQVLDWLNDGLRGGRPGRLASEYPLLFEGSASVNPLTLWAERTPIAFCTLWAVQFRIGAHRLRTGLISLVYTDPAHRGQGHASRLVRAAIDRAAALDLGLLLLWSDLDALYASLGFSEAGHESLLVLDLPTVRRALERERPDDVVRVERATPADWPEIERLRCHRTCQLELDPGELGRARSIPDIDVRVARGPEGVRGFAMRGRGDDLAEVVHEWGGDAGAALFCCESLLLAFEPGNELFLMTPSDHDTLSWMLRQAGARRVRKSLAWMRIASPGAFAQDLSAMLPGLSGLAIEVGAAEPGATGTVQLRTARGESSIEPVRLFDALFGSARPESPEALLRALEPALGPAACHHLPIPLFVWGLESI